MMSEQRFTYDNPIGFGKGEIIDNQNNIHYEATISVLLQLLNDFDDVFDEQQATIEQQERKIRKCEAEVGRQLKQIIELQDELNDCRARPTLATDEMGFVKVEYR